MFYWRSGDYRLIPSRKETGALRCMFVITSMPVGGAETLLVNMLRGFKKSVIAPEVICLKEPGPLGDAIADEFPLHSGFLSSKYDLRVLPKLIGLMHRRAADAVITVGAGDKMFWGRLAAHVAGVPVIASALHSTGWPDGVGRLNRMLTPITDAFIAVADAHGEFLREHEKFPDDKIHVIRNGVDCKRFRPNPVAIAALRAELGLQEDAFLIGIVAALRSEKNHAMLVRAAARLRKTCPDAHWVIVGDGPERQSIEDLAADLKIDDRIHLLGTRLDTPRILAGLDLLTLCSLNEASPVSILEALACGVPVVATDVGSVSESVKDGVTGRLIASEDIDAMVDAVGSLLANPASRREMGDRGRQLVLETGSQRAMIRGYQDLVTRLYDQATRQQSAGRQVSLPTESWITRLVQRLATTRLRKPASGK